MSLLETLLSRRSVPAQCLIGPGPNEAQLASALDAALRAPDHGRMQPWRFHLIRGAARAAFADLLVAAARTRDPATPQAQLDKLHSRPLQVPVVIGVGARVRNNPKVPEIEQLLAAGSGVMNLLNALHLQGFGAIWLTGPSAYDPAVARALGCDEGERLLGFVYAGTIGAVVPAAPARPARTGFVREWTGPA